MGGEEGAPRASGEAAGLLPWGSQTQRGVRESWLCQLPAVRPGART